MFLDLFIAALYTSCLEMPEKCTHQHVSGMPFKTPETLQSQMKKF